MNHFPNGDIIPGSRNLNSVHSEFTKIDKLITETINGNELTSTLLVDHEHNGLMSSADKIKIDSINPGIWYGIEDRISIVNDVVDISDNYKGQSSITTVGTLTSGSLGPTFETIDPQLGGTGVNNGANTITLGGNLVISNELTINGVNATITIPKSGTLAMTDDLIEYSGTIDRISIIDDQINISDNYKGQTSITTVGTLTSGSLGSTFETIDPQIGGTGVNNGTNTITLGGNLIINNGLTIMNTNEMITIPKSGTLVMMEDLIEYSGTTDRISINDYQIDIANNYSGQSSITTVGTLTSGSLGPTFETISPQLGGTGISNSSTITLGGNLVISNELTINGVSATVIVPKSGTLAMTDDINGYVGTTDRISITDGQIDIASTYSGQSSITTVGTLTSGSFGSTFDIISPQLGGTGVSNTSTITLSSDLTTIGPGPITLNTTGITNITLPTNGTLATIDNIPNITGTTNRIDVITHEMDYMPKNQSIDISPNYSGQSSITTVGTLSSGTLSSTFTPIPIQTGGTGHGTFTKGDIIHIKDGESYKVSVNDTTTRKYLSESTGIVKWKSLTPTDIPGSIITTKKENEAVYPRINVFSADRKLHTIRPFEITTGWNGVLSSTRGGTGINNGSRTISINNGNFSTGGDTNLTLTGNTNITIIPGTFATKKEYLIMDNSGSADTLTTSVKIISNHFRHVTTSGTSMTYINHGRININTTGLYYISYNLHISSISNIAICLNGNTDISTNRHIWNILGGNYNTMSGSGIMKLNAGDYIQIMGWANSSTANLPVSVRLYTSIVKIY